MHGPAGGIVFHLHARACQNLCPITVCVLNIDYTYEYLQQIHTNNSLFIQSVIVLFEYVQLLVVLRLHTKLHYYNTMYLNLLDNIKSRIHTVLLGTEREFTQCKLASSFSFAFEMCKLLACQRHSSTINSTIIYGIVFRQIEGKDSRPNCAYIYLCMSLLVIVVGIPIRICNVEIWIKRSLSKSQLIWVYNQWI